MSVQNLYEKAVDFYVKKNFKKAKEFAKQCTSKDKQHSGAFNLLGAIAAEEKNYDTAKDYYQKSIDADANNAQAYNNLGNVYAKLEQQEEAEAQFLKSIEANSDFLDPYFNLATLYKEQKEYKKAKIFFEKVLLLDVNFASAYLNLGIIAKEAEDYNEALRLYAVAVRIKPDFGEAYSNISVCMYELKQIDRAKAAAYKSIELAPNSAVCYSNFALLLNACGDAELALKCLHKAYELEPDNKQICSNFAIALLGANDYKNGLTLYSSRPISRLICSKPIWNGEDLSDKTIVIYHEQGLGDSVHFARLLPLIKQKAKKLLFIPQEPLFNLFKNSTLNIDLITKDELLKGEIDFDYHGALLDLMTPLSIFEPTKNINYINIQEDKKEQFLQFLPKDKFKIGIAWKGNKSHIQDKSRSCGIDYFGQIASIQNVALVSLQKEDTKDDIKKFRDSGFEILDFAEKLHDFEYTAALIYLLDLVICVDTSVAHIAATMQKPTWILTATTPDWRWGYGKNTKWYDSVRLFRRQDIFDWDKTFNDVTQELKKLPL